FRIASLSKPITGAAIDALVGRGKLSLHDKVFELLKLPPPPAGSTPDPRLKRITIENLLQHRGGWDKKAAGDPTYDFAPIEKAMGLDHPPDPSEIAIYMSGQPLQFDPGSQSVYSNFGYMLLGLVIEKLSGMSVHDFVKKSVFVPLTITDVVPAH